MSPSAVYAVYAVYATNSLDTEGPAKTPYSQSWALRNGTVTLRKPGVSFRGFARGAKKPRRALPASKKLGPFEPRTWPFRPAFWTCEMAWSAHVARRLHMEAGKVESVGGPRIQQAMLPPKPPQYSPCQHPRGILTLQWV